MHRPVRIACQIAVLALLCSQTLPASARAGSLRQSSSPVFGVRRDVLSPLVTTVLNPPQPVLGADNRIHLAYELFLVNQSMSFVTLDVVTAFNPARSAVALKTLRGSKLASVLNLTGGPPICDCVKDLPGAPGRTLAPSRSAYLIMDVSLGPHAAIPGRLAHRFSLGLHSTRTSPAIPLSFSGASTSVRIRRAIVVSPPLAGPRWLVGNGCCADLTAHRGSTLSINGTVHVAERFAIDFVQVNAQGRLFSGDLAKLTSFRYFGDKVYAVADGVVVGTQDGLPEQVPGKLPSGITVQTAGGNYIVEKIAPGHFAFYAHLQPRSLRVHKGDRIRRGKVIGLLGNTGNSDGPHLHFHVMDGPSPLRSNGLPFVFTSFTGQGTLTSSDNDLLKGLPVRINRRAPSGVHHRQLPFNHEFIRLP